MVVVAVFRRRLLLRLLLGLSSKKKRNILPASGAGTWPEGAYFSRLDSDLIRPGLGTWPSRADNKKNSTVLHGFSTSFFYVVVDPTPQFRCQPSRSYNVELIEKENGAFFSVLPSFFYLVLASIV